MPDLYAMLKLTIQGEALIGDRPAEVVANWFRRALADDATPGARCMALVGPGPQVERQTNLAPFSTPGVVLKAQWLVQVREACYVPALGLAPTPDSAPAAEVAAERAAFQAQAWQDLRRVGTRLYAEVVGSFGAVEGASRTVAVDAVPFTPGAPSQGTLAQWTGGQRAVASPTQERASIALAWAEEAAAVGRTVDPTAAARRGATNLGLAALIVGGTLVAGYAGYRWWSAREDRRGTR
jgi:hypothetical protein